MILLGSAGGASSSMIAGVRIDKIYVIDYWRGNEHPEHKLLILNRSMKTIQLEARIITVLEDPTEALEAISSVSR